MDQNRTFEWCLQFGGGFYWNILRNIPHFKSFITHFLGSIPVSSWHWSSLSRPFHTFLASASILLFRFYQLSSCYSFRENWRQKCFLQCFLLFPLRRVQQRQKRPLQCPLQCPQRVLQA